MKYIAAILSPFVIILTMAFARFIYEQWVFVSIMFRVALAGVGILAVVAVGLAVTAGLVTWQEERQNRADEKRRNNIEIVIAEPGQQVYQIEYDTSQSTETKIRPIHLSPGELNGKPTTATDEDKWRWLHYNLLHSPKPSEKTINNLLGDGGDTKQIDLRPPQFNLLDRLPGGKGDVSRLLIADRVNPDTGNAQPIWAHIEDIVHPMFSGETNVGKSTAARGLAYQFVTADNTQHYFADPSNTTWKTLDGSNGQLAPILKTDNELLSVLSVMLTEANRRVDLFEPYPVVEKLSEYNQTANDNLPYIMMFVDEFPAFMANKAIHKLVCDNLFLLRKAGLYICGIGTYWNADTIGTKARSCFVTRVALASSPEASRVVIGSNEAADLDGTDRGLGYGKLLFGDNGHKPFLLRMPYLDKRDAYERVSRTGNVPALPEFASVAEIDEKDADILDAYDDDPTRTASTIASLTIGKGGPQAKRVRRVIALHRGKDI